MNEKNIKVLAAEIRLETLKVIHSRGFGHVGGSMDLADLMAVLYGENQFYKSDSECTGRRISVPTGYSVSGLSGRNQRSFDLWDKGKKSESTL